MKLQHDNSGVDKMTSAGTFRASSGHHEGIRELTVGAGGTSSSGKHRITDNTKTYARRGCYDGEYHSRKHTLLGSIY